MQFMQSTHMMMKQNADKQKNWKQITTFKGKSCCWKPLKGDKAAL